MEAEIAIRKQTEEQLREMSARVLRLQDDERRCLAGELHDGTAQTLSALSLNLAVVNQCSDIAKHPKRALPSAKALRWPTRHHP